MVTNNNFFQMSLSKVCVKRKMKHDPVVMQWAYNAVMCGMSLWGAQQEFKLPKSTIQDMVKQGGIARKGREPIIPKDIEDCIAEWLRHMARIGYGQTKGDIFDKVAVLVKKFNILTTWVDGRPTEKWYWGFMGWYPTLNYRTVSALNKKRASVSFDNIYEWFCDLHSYVIKIGHPYIFDDPTCVYNCDETGFPLAPKPHKVLVKWGSSHNYQSGVANTKMQITILLCASAVGHYTKPLIVYPGVQPRLELHEKFHETFEEGLFGNSESDWMDSKLFVEWLESGFNECIIQWKVTKPVLLLINGTRVHLSIEASEFCGKYGIILYTLYPNATHIIQPLDLMLMSAVKSAYKEDLRKWYMQNIGESFDKYRFVEVFKETYMRACKMKNAIEGFEEAGIVPWNPNKVKTKKLFPSEIYCKQEPFPQVAADTSINAEDNRENIVPTEKIVSPGKTREKEVSPKEKEVSPEEKAISPESSDHKVEKEMVITVGKKKFKLVEVEDIIPEKTRQETIDEVLALPKPKTVQKKGGCRVPGFPRCVSSQEFQDQLKAIEDAKQVKQDDIEKHKAKCKAEAEHKWEEKKKAAEVCKAQKKTTKKGGKKRKRRGQKQQESSESEEEEEPEYADDSSEMDESEESALLYRCSECWDCFTRAEHDKAIGCDCILWPLVPPQMYRYRCRRKVWGGNPADGLLLPPLLGGKVGETWEKIIICYHFFLKFIFYLLYSLLLLKYLTPVGSVRQGFRWELPRQYFMHSPVHE